MESKVPKRHLFSWPFAQFLLNFCASLNGTSMTKQTKCCAARSLFWLSLQIPHWRKVYCWHQEACLSSWQSCHDGSWVNLLILVDNKWANLSSCSLVRPSRWDCTRRFHWFSLNISKRRSNTILVLVSGKCADERRWIDFLRRRFASQALVPLLHLLPQLLDTCKTNILRNAFGETFWITPSRPISNVNLQTKAVSVIRSSEGSVCQTN